ncbi:uncharacterized protein LOC110410808 isoform X2 [Herrania umbratica]|uniref:Uncharacterized protein LOC110410808 isoform X2 n=1 Tax=Herrania umbratica TaxID=108875 RepID=A0A6J0ZPA4_9ROSI|nr:uncharacterized protein LOC110410808 isoform X2 [Herrania umbratica]
MSWLLKSLQSDVPDSPTSSPDNSPTNRNAGVKEDLSVLGETIGRQLRGVAAFLAPPPSSPPSVTAAEREQQDQEKEEEQEQPSDKLVGIRNDLAEIGGSFKSGLSLLSSNKAVTEISRFASGFLQLPSQDDHGQNDDDDDDDDDDDGVPGITEDVVAFVKEISNRPEFWTDFPLSLHNDFKMSEAQREHAENIEHLVPSFEDLKVNLHSHMGDERFWMIYFILLLPRLNEHDFELLSTPEQIHPHSILLFISLRSDSPVCCSISEKSIRFGASAIRAEGPLNLVERWETKNRLLKLEMHFCRSCKTITMHRLRIVVLMPLKRAARLVRQSERMSPLRKRSVKS